MRLTANRLTLLRILLIPVPCALFYGGPTAKLTALGVASLLGLTDYFDGKLARRQGVTRLGALLDPIADKIFVAVFYLLLARFRYLPLWLVLLILLREFLITGLRQLVPGNLPVSWLAKLKTTVQMLAAGLIVVVQVFPAWSWWGLLAVALIMGAGVWWTNFKTRQKLLVTGWSLLLPLLSFLPQRELALILGIIVLCLTWLSGVDYLQKAWPFLFSQRALILFVPFTLPIASILAMPFLGRFWLVVPLILIAEFSRQALGLLGPYSAKEDKVFGLMGLAGLIWYALCPQADGLLVFWSVVLVLDTFLVFKKAYQLRTYLRG